jgi:hypothetical protein
MTTGAAAPEHFRYRVEIDRGRRLDERRQAEPERGRNRPGVQGPLAAPA